MPFLFERAYRAVAAARGVAEALTERFGPEPSPFGPESFRFGIGVNSGPVVVGSVGGGGRLEFAVIGDPVNVAARVENLTRRRATSCRSPRRPAASCRATGMS